MLEPDQITVHSRNSMSEAIFGKETMSAAAQKKMKLEAEPHATLGQAAAQAFVDADALVRKRDQSNECFDLRRFSGLTRIPHGISAHAQWIDFSGCTLLTSVAGLPTTAASVDFIGCSSLVDVRGLPSSVRYIAFDRCTSLVNVELPSRVLGADFTGCTALASVTGIPQRMEQLYFTGCTSLTSVRVRPGRSRPPPPRRNNNKQQSVLFDYGTNDSSMLVRFTGCKRLRRIPKTYYGGSRRPEEVFDLLIPPCPSIAVRTIMRSGACDTLLRRVGPDVALLIGCFATAGLNSSSQFDDCMEARSQVLARYFGAAASSSYSKAATAVCVL